MARFLPVGISAALFAAYAIAFTPLYRGGVDAVAVLVLPPLAFTGWRFGARAGALAGMIGGALTAVLFVSNGYLVGVLDVVFSIAALVGLGAAVGRIAELGRALSVRLALHDTLMSTLARLGEAIVVSRDTPSGTAIVASNDAATTLSGQDVRGLAQHATGDWSVDASGGTTTLAIARRSFVHSGDAYSVTVAHDVSERAAALAAVRDSDERIRQLLTGIPAFVFATDLEGRITFASENVRDVLGVDLSDIVLPASRRARTHPDDHATWAEAHERAKTDGYAMMEARWQRGDGQWVWLHSERRLVLDAHGRPKEIVGYATDVTEKRRAHAERQQRARRDELTALPNRIALLEFLAARIARAEAREQVVVVVANVDEFSEVNESFGEQIGDEVLRLLARRLSDIDHAQIIARIGGDKFAVVFDSHGDAAQQLGVEVHRVLSRPLGVRDHEVALDIRIGIALAPTHAQDATQLLRCAEVAVSDARRLREQLAVYTPERDGANRSRVALAQDLRHAARRGELLLHYQPVVDLRTRRVSHVEALVRWRHPTRGLVPPGDFIPLAEQTGIMKTITDWVLAEALRQCWAWNEEGIDVGVAVNMSVRNLHDPELPLMIRRLLDQYALDPSQLTIEITESTVMNDPARVLETLARLRSMRIRLAVDDFGTGYSSLAYLNRLPVDAIKIDRSFLRDADQDESAAAIVRATVELSHTLGFSVVAEGVEHARSLEMLTALGCDFVQGYHLSRPLPASDLAEWVRHDAAARGIAAPASAPGADRGTILVIDNHDVVRMTTQILLARNGFGVTTATCGRDAVRTLDRDETVTSVFVDVSLPDGDGIALAESLRRIRPNLKVVFMSGHPASTLALPAGATFLQKPFTEQSLIASLGLRTLTERAQILARN
ncbi:MAG TPA: EAL domain-containing protein [Candidatus Limnocylindrales bacterium]|nr:EAL domain-containing protein [Candidatus Limnocylindrales bacterium]